MNLSRSCQRSVRLPSRQRNARSCWCWTPSAGRRLVRWHVVLLPLLAALVAGVAAVWFAGNGADRWCGASSFSCGIGTNVLAVVLAGGVTSYWLLRRAAGVAAGAAPACGAGPDPPGRSWPGHRCVTGPGQRRHHLARRPACHHQPPRPAHQLTPLHVMPPRKGQADHTGGNACPGPDETTVKASCRTPTAGRWQITRLFPDAPSFMALFVFPQRG